MIACTGCGPGEPVAVVVRIRAPSPTDARQQVLTLTDAGRAAFEPLQQRSREEAAALLRDVRQLVTEQRGTVGLAADPGEDGVTLLGQMQGRAATDSGGGAAEVADHLG